MNYSNIFDIIRYTLQKSQTFLGVTLSLVLAIAADMSCKHFMESSEQYERLYMKIKALN